MRKYLENIRKISVITLFFIIVLGTAIAASNGNRGAFLLGCFSIAMCFVCMHNEYKRDRIKEEWEGDKDAMIAITNILLGRICDIRRLFEIRSRYEIDVFYPYPSSPTGIMYEYCDNDDPMKGDPIIKDIVESAISEVVAKTDLGEGARDNKITVRIKNDEGKELYLGFKDGFYRIGTGVRQKNDTCITFDKSVTPWKSNLQKISEK